jgi:FkbM family methyltransferase
MKIVNILNSLGKYIESPELFSLRQKGVTASQYSKYGQPWIREIDPLTIFDIGANIGQSAIALNALFPKSIIYSFEPIPNCFKTLELSTRNIDNINVFNLGLGDGSGLIQFEVNDFSGSSSFLSPTDIHKNAFAYASNTQLIEVKMDLLDNVMSDIDVQYPVMMKIDVQGFEDKVLKGGENIVSKSSILIIETSFKTLYFGQPLFHDIYNLLREWGFEYQGCVDSLADPKTGEILQSDSIFVKSNH